MIISPPILSCNKRDFGISIAPAVIKILSKGDVSLIPKYPSPYLIYSGLYPNFGNFFNTFLYK